MSKYEKLAIVCAFVVLVLGLLMAWHFKDGLWFGRSGSLVTVVAVVFASLQLRGRVEKAPAFAEEQLKHLHETLHLSPGFEKLRVEQQEEIAEEVKQSVRRDVADITGKVTRRLYFVELWLFIIGTLIWGYADVPLDWWLKNCLPQ